MFAKAVVSAAAALAVFGLSCGIANADDHEPDVMKNHCAGGSGGFLKTKWCDGARYPDGSYWHQLIMTGSSFTGPVFRLDCVTDNGSPLPPLAPPGACGGEWNGAE